MAEPKVEPPKEPAKTEPPKEPAKAEPVAIDTTKFKLGDDFEISEDHMKGYAEVLKDLGMNQEQGQKLLDFYTKVATDASERASKLWDSTNDEWQEQVKADKEIGGDNLLKVKQTVSKAFETFGDPGVREALDMTGAGNHPAIVRTLYRMAQKLTEGGFVQGAPAAKPRTAAEILYGKQG